jgi:RNA polymerase sigma-70 factor, ECF subfamily
LLCASAEVVVTRPNSGVIVDTGTSLSELTFERIYDERFSDVERWIRAFGGRAPDVVDLAQDVFIVALRRLSEFDGQNLPGWLYQITRRKMRDYRRLSWIQHLFTNRNGNTFDVSAISADQFQHVENRESQVLLDGLLNKLPDEQRAAFVLFELDGLTGAEIAEIQQVPINTVWARIHRARKKLQARACAAQKVAKFKR